MNLCYRDITMLKCLSLTCLVIGLCQGSVINIQKLSTHEKVIVLAHKPDVLDKWRPTILEFIELIDIDKIVPVIIKHLTDPELSRFLDFLLSPKFLDVVWEIESLAEFKEAYMYLEYKGYDVEIIINVINSLLNLPEFEKPRLLVGTSRGMTEFLEDLLAALPLEEMKGLFEKKLEQNEDVKEIFDTVNSEEFLDILKRLLLNPKFNEIKGIFEGYGFDFKFICNIVKEIFGKYLLSITSIFCT